MNDNIIQKRLGEAQAWAMSNGLVMGESKCSEKGHYICKCSPCPFSLYPIPFPKDVFNNLCNLQSDMAELFNKVAHDDEFLLSTMQLSANEDEFVLRQLNLLKQVIESKHMDIATLSIARSDYMIDNPNTPLQVEYNTMAASFGALSSKVSSMHKYLVSRYGKVDDYDNSRLPENNTINNLCDGFYKAFQLHPKHNDNGCIIMIVQPGETNVADQRLLEYELYNKHGIICIRKTLLQIQQEATITDDNDLIIEGFTACIVYFRAGYTPVDYPSDFEWEGKNRIEFSSAIKCPCIRYWLAGSKKVQQVLTNKQILSKYINNNEVFNNIYSTFAELYSLDDDEQSQDIIEKACLSPHDYVLKPQREGGGNNIWGEHIPIALKKMTPEERAAFVIMKKINPQSVKGILIRNGGYSECDCVNELGVFGCYVKDNLNDKMIMNAYSGFLLRTKKEGVLEGGVATGYAVLSSPYLS